MLAETYKTHFILFRRVRTSAVKYNKNKKTLQEAFI